MDGSKVALKDAAGRDVLAKTKVETNDKACQNTEVSTTQSNGNNKIEWIGLAGTKTKVVFE